MSRIYFILLLCVAGGMTVRGFALEQNHPGPELRLYCAVQYCTGLVLCGIALLIDVVGRSKK